MANIKIIVNQNNIKDYDSIKIIAEKEIKARYKNVEIFRHKFFYYIFIINNKKYRLTENSNFKIIELEEIKE